MPKPNSPEKSPEKEMSALRGWLIKIGLLSAPKAEPKQNDQDSEERAEAKRILLDHIRGQPPSNRW